METTMGDTVLSDPQEKSLRVSAEWVAYGIVVFLAMVLRLAELDSVPMSQPEAEQAMRVYPLLNGSEGEQLPDSPLMFALQAVSFTLLGVHESSSRLLTALGGVFFALTPLLFRAYLGPSRAFLWVVLLAFSPIVLMASRTSSTTIWTLFFAMVGLWALWRFRLRSARADALLGAGSFAMMVFLSGPSGPLVALTLAISATMALSWQTLAIARGDQEETNALGETFKDFPWLVASAVGGGVVFVAATLFMMYPSGLGMVGQLLETSLGGFLNPTPSAPPAYPLWVLGFYEPFLILFAIGGYVLRSRRGELNSADRFCASWAIVALGLALVYVGGRAEYALWLVIPLTYWASYAVVDFWVHDASTFFWLDDDFINMSDSEYMRAIARAKWVTALVAFILLCMLSVHFQAIGRALLALPVDANLWFIFTDASLIMLRYAAIWAVITILLMLIGFFVVAGFYGSKTPLQGAGLGLFAFMLITGVGSGWNAVVTHASNPLEPWHIDAVFPDAYLLRQTLYDIAERDSRGVPLMTLYVVAQDAVLSPTGIIGWLLRDFPNARFVNTVVAAQRQQIVLTSDQLVQPNLGGSYVGQSFHIRSFWDNRALAWSDSLAWWTQRRIRNLEQPKESVILWLRQDVYNGVPPNERP